MWSVVQRGYQTIIGITLVPHIVHIGIRLLYASYGEEFVPLAVDKEHRLGARDGCNVVLIEVIAQPGYYHCIRRATLCLVIGQRHQRVGNTHPTYRSRSLHTVGGSR